MILTLFTETILGIYTHDNNVHRPRGVAPPPPIINGTFDTSSIKYTNNFPCPRLAPVAKNNHRTESIQYDDFDLSF